MARPQLMLLLPILMLTACARTEGSAEPKASGNSAPVAAQVLDINATEFGLMDSVEMNPDKAGFFEYGEKRFSVGCQQIESKKNIIPGSFALKTSLYAYQNVSMQFIQKLTLEAQGKDAIQLNEKMLSLDVKEFGGELLKSTFEKKRACDFAKGDLHCEKDSLTQASEVQFKQALNPMGEQFYQAVNVYPRNLLTRCTLKNESGISVKTYVGKYRLPNDTVVNAYLDIQESEGAVVCGQSPSLGKGTRRTLSVRSNEVMPVDDQSFCGGVSLLGETVVQSYRTTVQDASLRH